MITYKHRQDWRPVSVSHARKAAAHSSRGIDWGGSSKGDIYDWFSKEKPVAGTLDRKKFCETMYQLVEFTRRSRLIMDTAVNLLFQHPARNHFSAEKQGNLLDATDKLDETAVYIRQACYSGVARECVEWALEDLLLRIESNEGEEGIG